MSKSRRQSWRYFFTMVFITVAGLFVPKMTAQIGLCKKESTNNLDGTCAFAVSAPHKSLKYQTLYRERMWHVNFMPILANNISVSFHSFPSY